MHVDFLHNFDSFPTTLLILSQPLSFGHKYNEKKKKGVYADQRIHSSSVKQSVSRIDWCVSDGDI